MSAAWRRQLAALYRGQGPWVWLYIRLRSLLFSAEQLAAGLPESGKIIDIGCGYGMFVNWLSLGRPGNSWLGFDLDEKRIVAARRTVGDRKNVSFFAGDAVEERLPRCAGVCMIDFLHHIPRARQARLLANVYRALRPGGVLMLAEVDNRKGLKFLASYLADVVLYPFSCRCQYKEPGLQRRELEQMGFSVETEEIPHRFFSGIRYLCRKQGGRGPGGTP